MIAYIIKEYGPNDRRIRQHHLVLPRQTMPGGYVMLTSINAFRRREDARAARAYDKGETLDRWFDVTFADRPDSNDICRTEPDLEPPMTHETLWAFYETIGYDHKANRFRA